MNTNRQFIKLTGAKFPLTGSSIIIPVSNITSVSRFSDESFTRVWDARLKPAGDDFWEVIETPEQIYAMLEPYQPAALLDEYEKLANITTNVKFRLTETLCKHIPSHIKVNAAALADDIESVCKEITDLADAAKRKAK